MSTTPELLAAWREAHAERIEACRLVGGAPQDERMRTLRAEAGAAGEVIARLTARPNDAPGDEEQPLCPDCYRRSGASVGMLWDPESMQPICLECVVRERQGDGPVALALLNAVLDHEPTAVGAMDRPGGEPDDWTCVYFDTGWMSLSEEQGELLGRLATAARAAEQERFDARMREAFG